MRYRSLLSAAAIVLLAGHGVPQPLYASTGDITNISEVTDITVFTNAAPVVGGGDPSRVETYIVLLRDEPVIDRQRGRVASAAESAGNHRAQLRGRQDAFVRNGRERLNRDMQVTHQYTEVLNGVAVRVNGDEARALAQDPAVLAVVRDEEHWLATYAGPSWVGADGIWEGPAGLQSRGEGIIIGIIDSGVNPASPSFAETDPTDGYQHVNPYGSGVFVGVCNPSHPQYMPSYTCNDKLIGAYYFLSGHGAFPNQGAFDENGHGSHVASTAAGNNVNIDFSGASLNLSGVAPRANIINYRVCGGAGTTCFTSDSAAAIDRAVLDGVDVLNFSIGGGTNPAGDLASLAFLRAADAGVFVAAAAGNFNPNRPGNSAHRGGWMTTVASVTHNGLVAHPVSVTGPAPIAGAPQDLAGVKGTGPDLFDIGFTTVGTGSQGKGQGQLRGQGGDLNEGKVEYRWAGNLHDVEGCTPFAADAFAGTVALIRRGSCDFWQKVDHARDAGAIAVVVYNNAAGLPFVMGAQGGNTIPSVMVTQEAGLALVDWLGTHGTAHISIAGTAKASFSDSFGDIMAVSSGRGPVGNLLKPDVAAPGASVLAAYVPNADSYRQIGGTSMASPHVAGAAALLRAIHPSWSPLEIKSALMTTGRVEGVRQSDASTEANPYDIGGGRINVDRAVSVGLVLHETRANFEAGNAGGNRANLNVASFSDGYCNGTCSWTRTVRSTRNIDTNWTITATPRTPGLTVDATPSISVGAGGTASFTVTADTSGISGWSDAFFDVVLTDNSGQSPPQRMVGAVQRPGQGTYVVATNATDATCAMPFSTAPGSVGGWANFQAFGINPNPGITGDTVGFTWFPGGSVPIWHHGAFFTSGVHFRDDGFYFMPHEGIMVGPGTSPWVNRSIPTALQPNNLVAALWHDWRLVFNSAQNRGAAIINATVGGVPTFIHDFRRVSQFGTPGTVAASFQIAHRTQPSLTPGIWDIIFAYNHLDGSHLADTTVGLESLFGDSGIQFAYNDANLGEIVDGSAICFRWVPAD